ncbi:MAG: glycosyltransferase [Chloroflexi bacterium]|nr:glycosyltransferase [Chloroflexota bacterium]
MTRFALFYQSLVSDWNHGNAHFLRGLMRALQARGHPTVCYEQADNWSLSHLLELNPMAVSQFRDRFPDLSFETYDLGNLELFVRERLAGADVALVNEWNAPDVIRAIGRLASELGVTALFHDTHYRVVLDEDYRRQLGLEQFAHILAFSPSLAERYGALGLRSVTVLHEAADTSVFAPLDVRQSTDVVFVGNYGDGDRSAELEDYVFGPRARLPGLRYAVYGVRYPEHVVARMNDDLDIRYGGWLPNVEVPAVYSAARVVLHVPRRQYVELLPGTPTIRVFEALASRACLISLPWADTDGLFDAGADFVVAHSPVEMRDLIDWLCRDDAARTRIAQHGYETVERRGDVLPRDL